MTPESSEKNYFRIILGRRHSFSQDCFENGYVGVNYGMDIDFTNDLSDDWREFNRKYIPSFLERHPDKKKIAAGLACGAIHTLAKYLNVGDWVLCPDGEGKYNIGEISGDYFYSDSQDFLRHRGLWENFDTNGDLQNTIMYRNGKVIEGNWNP